MSWDTTSFPMSNKPQQALIYQSLTLDGASPVTATNRNMNVDGSVTPKRFKIQPPAGQIWQLTRLMFVMRDTGSFDSGGWGNRTAPLDDGVSVGLTINGAEYDLTPVRWTSHVDLAGVAFDVNHQNYGAGDEYLSMRLTFSKAGQNLRLVGDDGDNFWMQVNDDLTYLVEQRAMLQGFIENVYL